MRIASQPIFTTYEASLERKLNDPVKAIFNNIDWSFVYPLVENKYFGLPQRR